MLDKLSKEIKKQFGQGIHIETGVLVYLGAYADLKNLDASELVAKLREKCSGELITLSVAFVVATLHKEY